MLDWLGKWVVITPNCDDLKGAGTCMSSGSVGAPRWVLILGFAFLVFVCWQWVVDMHNALESRRTMQRRAYLGLCVYCGSQPHPGRECR